MLVALPMPDTGTGVELSVVVPFPSCPSPLRPQHEVVPSTSRAQECSTPVVTSVALSMPDTFTGVRLLITLPSPSWPKSLLPQHVTLPSSCTAQECMLPESTSAISFNGWQADRASINPRATNPRTIHVRTGAPLRVVEPTIVARRGYSASGS